MSRQENIKKDKNEIAPNVYYVGMLNPGMRNFDIIMYTDYGTTYNSYLILGEKNVLIETVHDTYKREFIEKIEEYIPISQLDYVILNHTEPDHSGSLSELLAIKPDLLVIATSAAIKNLGHIMNRTFQSQVVKQGDILEIGDGKKLEFIIAPNLHWPDTMFTYFEKEQILFSCDMFGCHYCEPVIFDYQLKRADRYEAEIKYYFDCIFSPFPKFVQDGLEKIENLEIKMICCSHGPVIKTGIEKTIALYKQWAIPQNTGTNAAIFYVSAYGYTAMIAEMIKNQMIEKGISVVAYDLLSVPEEKAVSLMKSADILCFGSPTINGDALEPIWNLINKTVVPLAKGKLALVFGSYGWSGEACQFLNDRLKALRYRVFPENLRIQFKPSEEEMNKGKEIVDRFLDSQNK